MCMLLPTVVFSNYRRKGEKVLIPTGSHGWAPSGARISYLSARSAGKEWMEPGCADPPAPTTCHWGGLTVFWGPLRQKLHGKCAAWGQRSFLWPYRSRLWLAVFATSPLRCSLVSELITSKQDVLLVFDHYWFLSCVNQEWGTENGIMDQKSKRWFLEKTEYYRVFQRV